ncbi:MAG TPA: elongation factor G [Dehalococcoidia bacterium]|jgi:elongation factor G|nr:elongation factor G [Dehalococcoidia bacterium]
MKEYKTEQIRNAVLLGHGGTGKTSVAEAAAFLSGAISRMGRVDDGNTVSDFEPDEVKRKISLSLSLIPVEWSDHKINLIDCPGYTDFVGEVQSGIAAADFGIIVVDAVSGVQVGTEQAWMHAERARLPRILFVNRMDRENANFDQALAQLQQRYGKRVAAFSLPIGSQDSFSGVVNLIDQKAYAGDKGNAGDAPADMADAIAAAREQLIEAICEADDDVMAKYLEGEDLGEEELIAALRKGIATGTVYPVFPGSALKNVGIGRLLTALITECPSPADVAPRVAQGASGDEPLKADSGAPLAALVFKTAADPFVGKLTYLRVLSGTLKGDSHVWDANQDADERVGQIIILRGKTQDHAPNLAAGDIGAVAKLAHTATGDTVCAKEHSVKLPPIEFPRPPFNVAVTPKGKADVDKLGPSLQRIAEEDPTLIVHRDETTGETIMSGMGETHVEVAAEKMKRKFGVEVDLHAPRVPYRETVTSSVDSEYIHKKQTGGHGQYARVAIKVEPNKGNGFQFVDAVVGGAVPRNYIPAVEKGVHEALQEGALAHFPMVDIRVTLFDGKEHPVDSSEMAFKLAGSQALKQGALKANPVLLEPVVTMQIHVPESNTGDVMSDLNGKRAKVHGMTPDDGGMTVIDAEAPLAEVLRYATDLRSITQGRGSFEMSFDHYEEVPQHIAQKVITEANKAREAVHA